jgi:hypothetical protein
VVPIGGSIVHHALVCSADVPKCRHIHGRDLGRSKTGTVTGEYNGWLSSQNVGSSRL